MASDDLLAKREKIQREILALESSLGADNSIIDLLSSDSDDESDDSGPAIEALPDDLETERLRIQREIEELENTLGANAALAGVLEDSEHGSDSSDEDSDDDDQLDLPQNVETCLQMNLVYQEVLKEKLSELEQLLKENRQQQKEVEAQLSGPSTSVSSVLGLPPQKLYLGYFMKPYFKDKLTGLGPPANPETKERLSHGTRPIDELKIRRWEGWQKTLLTNGVAKDILKRMLQPKLSKLDYLSAKMSRAGDEEKEQLKKQMELIEKDIEEISTLKDDQLVGNRHDDHDWEKISNIDFEGLRQAEDLKRFWQNYLHPSINKSVWKQDEIDKLKGIVEEYNCCHWDKIAEALGTNRTAFMCFQTYQRYISKTFKRKEWTPEEDQILRDLVEKMRIGNFIPYIQMSYFMPGRDGSQLSYRWTSVLDPSIKKGPWSKEEDQLLRNAVAKYGPKEWGKIKMEVPGRTDGACRDRYLDCLQENVKKGPWSEEEVELLKKLVEKYGVGKWSKIASEIPNRVDCQCLNKWKLLTKACQNKGIKRERKPTTIQQKAKRRKVLRKKNKKEMGTSSSSEDEKKLKYMDSDAEPDVPLVEAMEMPQKDYVQTDMKKWIPANANLLVVSQETLRTVWVRLPTNEEELQYATKESELGRNRSEKSKCSKVRPILVRNTVLNRFGNIERTYVGMNPVVLQSQTDDEKAMIKVAESDIRFFVQCKGTSVIKNVKSPANKKKVQENPGNIKKRRLVQDMLSLKNDLLKAITPWIGNVIMPLPVKENTLCKGDIVGKKAEDIPLPKTSMLIFFIKAFHIDVMGCRNVIEIQQEKGIKEPVSVCNPTTVYLGPPKTVAVMLQEGKKKAEHKKPAEPPQHPPPLQPVHHLNPPQLPVRQMMPLALIHPNNLVITQPNIQEAVKPLMPKGQKVSLLLQSPPQAMSPIPPPVIKGTPPAQPITTSMSTSPSEEDSDCVRSTKRIRKPTEKVQALMEDSKAKSSKKVSQKQKKSKHAVQTVTLQTQPLNWILTPTGLVQITGPLSANIPSNQTLIVPNSSPLNNSTCPFTSTNLYPLSSAPIVAAASVSPALISSSVSDATSYTQKTSSSMNISPRGNNSGIQMPLSTTSLVQNQSMPHSVQGLSQAPTNVDQKSSNVEATKNSSDSSSDEAIVRQYKSSPSTVPSSSHAVFSVIPVPLTVQTLTSGPTNEVAKPCGVSENGLFPVKTSQLPTIIQQNSLPFTILSPVCAPGRPLQPLGALQFAASSPQVVASSLYVVAPSPPVAASPSVVAPPPRVVAQSPRVVASPSRVVAQSAHVVAPLPSVVAPSPCVVAPSPGVVAPPPRVVGPSPTVVAQSPCVDAPPPRVIAPPPPVVTQSPRVVAPSPSVVAPLPRVVAPPPRVVAPPPRVVAPPPRVVAPPPHVVAQSPRVVAPSPSVVAPSPSVVAPSPSVVAPSPSVVAPSPRVVAPPPRVVAPPPCVVAPPPCAVAQSPRFVAPSPSVVAPSPRVVAPSVVPQITTLNEPLIPISDVPSDGVSFDPHLIFPEQSSEVDDWINGKGGIPIPHLEMSLPYLPPSAASMKTLTCLLKAKQSLLTSAVKKLPVEYQNGMGEEAQVAAIRKMIAERFASNPAYLLFKARFLSCFTLPAILATINPSEKCQSDNTSDEDDDLHLLQRKKSVKPARIELNMNENEASAKQFSGIRTKRQKSRRQVT
ncbi:snRNA-activating protein complex subunit 4 [Chanodichthys erythropterus]|uniref:snRNA-activating protein complex subunit 4 n=1 Tax=Chanodichthys erythropterus TaxID=933992 RepID=UPI00351F58A0